MKGSYGIISSRMKVVFGSLAGFLLFAGFFVFASQRYGTTSYENPNGRVDLLSTASTSFETSGHEETMQVWPLQLDRKEYDERLLALSRYEAPRPFVVTSTTTENGVLVLQTATVTPQTDLIYASTTSVGVEGKKWPKSTLYPHGGAVLPFYRLLAYYGNFYSTKMGILGEYDPDTVLNHLRETKDEWEKADPSTPVMLAIEYIAMVAQGSAGSDGMYRSVMPDSEIEKAYALAKEINGPLILDIQIGLSTIENELPKFKKYLERPDVFFAIDPEFSMKSGDRPGTVIGTLSAHDINFAIHYMSDIVKEKQLPPKVLVIHRFTQAMVTHMGEIQPTPEVQVVINMDGWGSKDLKRGTYSHVIVPEPVQFAGIKLFYKNDLKPPSTGLLTPEEVLSLYPVPIYIQYQ